MRRRGRTLGYFVARSLAAAGVLYALVLAYVVPVALVAGPPPAADLDHPGDSTFPTVPPDRTTWVPALERRFPGCEDMAEWSGEQEPATVVVARGDRKLAKVPFDRAYGRAREASATGEVRIIGACR